MRDEALATGPDSFRLGEWEVFPGLNRIQRDDEVRPLEPKVMRVLVHLASRPGQVVGQQELIDEVWGQISVSPNVLTYSIAALRKALDDDWRAPSYVETISKGGYRLVAAVGAIELSAVDAPQAVGAEVAEAGGPSEPAMRDHRSLSMWLLAAAIGGATVAAVAMGVSGGWSSPDPAPGPRLLQPVPITADPGLEIHPAISPDGNHVAYAWRAEDGGNYDIYVKLLGSEAPARLVGTDGHDTSPAWTPDGLRIVFVTRTDDDCGIFQIPATGGASRRLSNCPGRPIGNLAVSPDGQRIALGAGVGVGAPTRIFLSNAAGDGFDIVGEPAATDQGDYYPTFSPDGTRLSFHRIRGDGLSDLYLAEMNDDGTGVPRRITFDNRDIGGHDWLADGETIVFSSYRSGQFMLWTVNAAGGETVPLGGTDHQMLSVDVARTGAGAEGHRAVYYRAVTDINLWGAHIAPDDALPYSPADGTWASEDWPPAGEPQRMVSSTRWEAHPDFSSDDTRITFASDRSGFYEIWSAAPDGSDPIQHTSFGGPYLAMPRFSPDDSTIVFDARPDGHADLWLVDADGTGPVQLTSDPGDEFAASYSPNGAWIYFTSNRTGAWEVWRIPAEGGEAIQFTQAGGYGPQAGADDYVYYTKATGPGIWRRPADLSSPEEETAVIPGFPVTDWGSWVVGAESIYAIVRAPEFIVRVNLETQQVTPLHPLGGLPPRQHAALAVTSAEDFLLYARIDRRETDVMLIEGLR